MKTMPSSCARQVNSGLALSPVASAMTMSANARTSRRLAAGDSVQRRGPGAPAKVGEHLDCGTGDIGPRPVGAANRQRFVQNAVPPFGERLQPVTSRLVLRCDRSGRQGVVQAADAEHDPDRTIRRERRQPPWADAVSRAREERTPVAIEVVERPRRQCGAVDPNRQRSTVRDRGTSRRAARRVPGDRVASAAPFREERSRVSSHGPGSTRRGSDARSCQVT